MANMIVALCAPIMGALIGALALFGGSQISAWERSHGYPYGRMCNSVFTLWEDTCR